MSTLAYALARGVPPGLAHADGRVAERLAQHARLGRLAGAVDSLEGHEQSAHGGDASSGRRPCPRLRLTMRGRMRALVTGGAGFIGSNLVDALLERGDEVTVLDDLSTGRRENLEGALGRAAPSSSRSTSATPPPCRDWSARAEPEAIFHLAAQIDVRRRWPTRRPTRASTWRARSTCSRPPARPGCGGVVNTSTGGAIYGEGKIIPAPEDHPVAPEAPYGLSKFCAEGYCELFARLHGLSTVSLRYGNVYGPRQDPLGEAGVVAIFCGKLLEGGQPTVFGDGLQTRDYVYVGDVVEANLAGCRAPTSAARSTSARGVADHRARHRRRARRAGRRRASSHEHEPERAGEVRHIALDASRAQAELGWSARGR